LAPNAPSKLKRPGEKSCDAAMCSNLRVNHAEAPIVMMSERRNTNKIRKK